MRSQGRTSEQAKRSVTFELRNAPASTHQQQVAANEVLVRSPDCLVLIINLPERGMESERRDEVCTKRKQQSHRCEYLQTNELLQGGADILVERGVGWVFDIVGVRVVCGAQSGRRRHGCWLPAGCVQVKLDCYL